MEVSVDDHCFVCGSENAAGLKAHFDIDHVRHRAICTIRIKDIYQGWKGMVHGGIIAALVDEAGIYACRSFGEHFVTAELNIKYKAPVPIDQDLIVSAEVIESRRRIFSVVGKIELAGKVLVESQSRIFAVAES
ncbi:MAG: acyl-CoA thioesterase [Desulfuromonadaceae bacterium GWC2_58_13]|nr:MAG: acyl-CoA thioesterase [Desulfuromonadaceae bacterium GWC2_58_13]